MSAGVDANILRAINEKKARLDDLNRIYLYFSTENLMNKFKELHTELVQELKEHIMILEAGRRQIQKFSSMDSSKQLTKLYSEEN